MSYEVESGIFSDDLAVSLLFRLPDEFSVFLVEINAHDGYQMTDIGILSTVRKYFYP